MRARSLLLLVSVTASLLAASGCGDDDFDPELDAGSDEDASLGELPAPNDAAVTDADADAGSPTEAIEECASCFLDDCLPPLFECLQDEACRELASCVIQAGCLQGGDLATCAIQCFDPGASIPDILAQAGALLDLVGSCSNCANQCGSLVPDGGLDFGGLGGFGGLPGAVSSVPYEPAASYAERLWEAAEPR